MDAFIQQVIRPFWQPLPPALARRLCINASTQAHLLDAASMAAAHSLPELTAQLLVAAWLADPLHGPTAGHVAALPVGFLSPDLAKAAKVVAASFKPPDRTARLEALEAAGDWEAMRSLVQKELRLAPGNTFWRWHGWYHAMGRQDAAVAEELRAGLESITPLSPLTRWLEAEQALLLGDPATAAAILESVAPSFQPWHWERLARAQWLLGDAGSAMQSFQSLLQQHPWQLGALLCLRDMHSGLATAASLPEAPTAICLYSFNKAAELDETLASLAQSEIGGASIRLLNNGSSDATASVCAAWGDRLGERCEVISLPVNVGAAPARNWLLALPEVQACEYVAFLDDDVVLPADWLGRLHAGLVAFPQAGVAGARVLEDASPAMLQQAEQFFNEDDPFAMADVQRHALDLGQFAYARPCVSVTGCCHLFRRAALDAVPAFDIRYSPTQYDDVDHDLALLKAGHPPLYQGHLAIRHKKRSGRGLLGSAVESSNAAANFHKLRAKWVGEKEALQERALGWTAGVVG